MARKSTRNTRGRIVAAAWKLFYEQGYEDTTVEEIIVASHTSKGSFYHYFDGKDALLSTLSTLFVKNTRSWRIPFRRIWVPWRSFCFLMKSCLT